MILDYSLISKIIDNHQFKYINLSTNKIEKVKSLSKFRKDIFLTCIEQACRSNMKYHKHGSVILLGNEILSTGYNSDYGTIIKGHWSLHAEVDSILKCKTMKKFINYSDLFVIRLKFNDRKIVGLNYSKPCNNCIRMAKKENIKRIYFS